MSHLTSQCPSTHSHKQLNQKACLSVARLFLAYAGFSKKVRQRCPNCSFWHDRHQVSKGEIKKYGQVTKKGRRDDHAVLERERERDQMK